MNQHIHAYMDKTLQHTWWALQVRTIASRTDRAALACMLAGINNVLNRRARLAVLIFQAGVDPGMPRRAALKHQGTTLAVCTPRALDRLVIFTLDLAVRTPSAHA
jgi:hypothetical protein